MDQAIIDQLRAYGQDPNVRHFLDVVIPGAEGTTTHGYNTAFGGGRIDDLTDHPRYIKPFKQTDGKSNQTSAAGKYQFLQGTWDDAKGKLGLSDFGPENQDLAAVYLLQQNGALPDLLAGNMQGAVNKSGKTWASLPSSPYAQPKQSEGFIAGLVNKMIPAAQAGTLPAQAQAPIRGNAAMNPNQPTSALPGARAAFNPEDPMSVYNFITQNQTDVPVQQLTPEQKQMLLESRQQRQSMLPMAIGASLAGDKRISALGGALAKDAMAARGPQQLGDEGWLSEDGTVIKNPFQDEKSSQARQDRALNLALSTSNAQTLRRMQLENNFSQAGFTPDGKPIVTNKTGQNYTVENTPNGPSYAPHVGPVIPKGTYDKNVQDAQILNSSASRSDAILKQVQENPGAFGIASSVISKLPEMVQGRASELALSQKEMQVRTDVLRQAAQEISDLYGAALSMGEQARANTFIPNPKDPPDVVVQKLKSARDWATTKANVYGAGVNKDANARTGNPQQPGAQAGQEERKTLGDKTYVKRNGQWFQE